MQLASRHYFPNSFGFPKQKLQTDDATVQAIMEWLEGLCGQIRGLMKIRCYRALPPDRPVAYTFLLDSSVEE